MWQADPNFNIVLIVALVFSGLIAVPIMIISLIYRNSQKRRETELIRMAIEKGQPVPVFPAAYPSKFRSLKAALVWMAVGIGLPLMVVFEELSGWSGIAMGFIPFLVGVALLIGWLIENKADAKNSAGS